MGTSRADFSWQLSRWELSAVLRVEVEFEVDCEDLTCDLKTLRVL
jgi:hypothetical protein